MVTILQSRRWLDSFVERHEIPWELAMGALAILYVVLGVVIDSGVVSTEMSRLEAALTAVFVLEFGSRLWAAPSRRRYTLAHLLDLIALLPATRALRSLRLLRLLRLVRVGTSLYRASSIEVPAFERLGWHLRRASSAVDRGSLSIAASAILVLVLAVAVAVTMLEKPWTVDSLGDSLYWAANTVLGSGDPGYVGSPIGWVLSWLLILLGLTLLAVATGTLVTFLVDVALKEGRGMGAAQYRDHVIICGWTPAARGLVDELIADRADQRVVILAALEANPAGSSAYFVQGEASNHDDLVRAGVRDARAALIFPSDSSDEADMRTILAVLAIETVAPNVRTIAEVNNPLNIDHVRRAGADEVVVPAQIAAHLLARSALYPGLTDLLSEMVTGGEGSELYRIRPYDDTGPTTVGEMTKILQDGHRAILLAVTVGDRTLVNPHPSTALDRSTDLLVLAESADLLAPFVLVSDQR